MTSLDALAEEIEAATGARDNIRYRAAFEQLVDALASASPVDVEPVLARFAPLLAEVQLGPAANLAQLTGSMAGMVTDTSPVLSVLVERGCQAMELAARFLDLHRSVLGEPPPATDMSAIQETAERFGAAVRDSVDQPLPLVEAWFAGSDWVQPVLFLAQRADVRAVLPQRERLLAGIEGIREHFPVADWLHGLLLVLDDTPLIVLHRSTGRGYRLTIGGVGDNSQLHTLLAARLIGDPTAGWLPGTPPTAEMVAAADGSGEMEPAGGVVGQFNLADPHGSWIWNEGRPADIPVFEGERVVVLDPAPYARSWNAGRIYPLMQPLLRVDAQMSADEAAAWLARVAPAGPPVEAEDLNVPLPPGCTVAALVDVVLQGVLAGTDIEQIEHGLSARFRLSEDDAALVRDRVHGGVVRAATGNPDNRPDPGQDPVAWESYRRAVEDPTLVARIHPELSSEAPIANGGRKWWRRKR
jgi:hypothetical protein